MCDEHVLCAVRLMLAHAIKPLFDEQDAVVMDTLSRNCMCVRLESARVVLMAHERDECGVVSLRVL